MTENVYEFAIIFTSENFTKIFYYIMLMTLKFHCTSLACGLIKTV